MQVKFFVTGARVASLLLIAGAAATAQVLQVSGKVTLKQADGSIVPIAGAVVDIYRTDIKQKFEVMTDRRGEYLRAGLPMAGTYTIAVSGLGVRPDYRAGIRLTRQPVNDFALMQGDGSRLTIEQIAAMGSAPAAPTAPAGESAETARAREAREKSIRELEEKNRELQRINDTVNRTFRAGNEALKAKRYDEAIAQFREGLAAREDEPALLTNLAETLRTRGDASFNAAITDQNPDRRNVGRESANKDWSEAALLSRKALGILKGSNPAEQPQSYIENRRAAVAVHALAMRRVATKVDQSQASAAWEAYQEYIAVETDPAKKKQLRGDALQMLFDSGSTDLALTEARKILATEPNHVDANRILGLALFASGDTKNFQEAANHLQRYVEVAPDTDPLKQSAKESLDYLKTAEGIEPHSRRATPRPQQRRP